MNALILETRDKLINGHGVTKEEVLKCQNLEDNEEELFTVYWIMSRYYLDRNQPDAMTYCILKCYELNEKYKFDLPYKVKNFMDARSEFMNEAINKTNSRLLPLSLLFGIISLVLVWFIMGNGTLIGFVLGFIAMNIVSINFQGIGSKKTIEAFKKKQYAAVYPYLDEDDKKFVDGR